ncbi:MAG: hypothetical protein ABW168_22820, partial [Sedimenticola sp.]
MIIGSISYVIVRWVAVGCGGVLNDKTPAGSHRTGVCGFFQFLPATVQTEAQRRLRPLAVRQRLAEGL